MPRRSAARRRVAIEVALDLLRGAIADLRREIDGPVDPARFGLPADRPVDAEIERICRLSGASVYAPALDTYFRILVDAIGIEPRNPLRQPPS